MQLSHLNLRHGPDRPKGYQRNQNKADTYEGTAFHPSQSAHEGRQRNSHLRNREEIR